MRVLSRSKRPSPVSERYKSGPIMREPENLGVVNKSPNSLMPNDLQKNLSEQDLVDLVEYLMTLKKKQ